MPTVWQKVPPFRQSTEGRCLEACVCMLLAHLESPVLESKVSALFEATEIGTPASRVLRLKKWGYHVLYRSASLAELRGWLEEGSPPIVFVHTQFLDYWTSNSPHAVVLVGMDDSQLYLRDPAFPTALQTCSLDGFLAAWTEMDEVAAVINTSAQIA